MDSFIFYGYVPKEGEQGFNFTIGTHNIVTSGFIKTFPNIEQAHMTQDGDKMKIDKSTLEFYYGGKLPRVPQTKLDKMIKISKKSLKFFRWYVILVNKDTSIIAEVDDNPKSYGQYYWGGLGSLIILTTIGFIVSKHHKII